MMMGKKIVKNQVAKVKSRGMWSVKYVIPNY